MAGTGMPKARAVNSRNMVNKFLDKLTGGNKAAANGTGDQCPALIAYAAARVGLTQPSFAGIVGVGEPISVASFPNYFIIWQGQTEGNSYRSKFHERVRMEIHYNHDLMDGDSVAARDYLHTIDEAVTDQMRAQRLRLLAGRVEKQLTIMALREQVVAGKAFRWLTLRREYGLSIRN